jgi:hypothetical protein
MRKRKATWAEKGKSIKSKLYSLLIIIGDTIDDVIIEDSVTPPPPDPDRERTNVSSI